MLHSYSAALSPVQHQELQNDHMISTSLKQLQQLDIIICMQVVLAQIEVSGGVTAPDSVVGPCLGMDMWGEKCLISAQLFDKLFFNTVREDLKFYLYSHLSLIILGILTKTFLGDAKDSCLFEGRIYCRVYWTELAYLINWACVPVKQWWIRNKHWYAKSPFTMCAKLQHDPSPDL